MVYLELVERKTLVGQIYRVFLMQEFELVNIGL